MLPAIPQRIKFFIQVLFIYLCLLFFLRLGFFAYFLPGDLTWNGSQIIDVLHAFYLGLKFDLRLILALLLPLFL